MIFTGLLEFRIFGQMLKGKTGMLVSDTIDYIDAEFEFRTDDWKGLSKWAHFTKGKTTYDVNLVDDKITKDMHLNLSEGLWEVKLHGNDPDGTLRITTNPISFCVNYFGKMPNGAPLPEIPLTAAEQIDAKAQRAVTDAGNALKKAFAVEADAANGKFNGADGPIGPTGPQGENGIGITDILVDQSFEDGGFNLIKIILTNNEFKAFSIMNGHTGKTGAAGLPGLVWQGEWNAETAYTAIKSGQISRDVVFYNGSAYVVSANSPAPVIGIVPENDITGSWALLVKQRDPDETGNGIKADAVNVDFSQYENKGIIVETYADGSTLTHNFEFDSEGKPTKRTDSAGGIQTFTW